MTTALSTTTHWHINAQRKTQKNFQADRWAFDDVALVHRKQRLATYENLTDCRAKAFRSFVLKKFVHSLYLSYRKRWTIIQIFKRVPLKLDATRRKGERFYSLLFLSPSFELCLSTSSDWVRAYQIVLFLWINRIAWVQNEHIENRDAHFLLPFNVWFNLHEILAADTKCKVNSVLVIGRRSMPRLKSLTQIFGRWNNTNWK